MAEDTAIAWTDHTFNPWMGCNKVSEGCRNCYAETLTKNKMSLDIWGPSGQRVVTSASTWGKVKDYNRRAHRERLPRRVFCASLCDVFEEHPVADQTRPKLWQLIAETPWLQWQLLTKRPERIASCLPAEWGPEGWPNVWLGTSIEDSRVAHRADILREIPAVVRFISYEPALGPLEGFNLTGIDWVIYGGESGPGYRAEDKQWARSMMAQCRAASVAFFHKQSAGWRTELGIALDGQIIREYPTPRVPATATGVLF